MVLYFYLQPQLAGITQGLKYYILLYLSPWLKLTATMTITRCN